MRDRRRSLPLDTDQAECHPTAMSNPVPLLDIDDSAAEKAALEVAVAEADADPREVPHAEMRAWLLQIAAGNFDAPAPEPRLL